MGADLWKFDRFFRKQISKKSNTNHFLEAVFQPGYMTGYRFLDGAATKTPDWI